MTSPIPTAELLTSELAAGDEAEFAFHQGGSDDVHILSCIDTDLDS